MLPKGALMPCARISVPRLGSQVKEDSIITRSSRRSLLKEVPPCKEATHPDGVLHLPITYLSLQSTVRILHQHQLPNSFSTWRVTVDGLTDRDVLPFLGLRL